MANLSTILFLALLGLNAFGSLYGSPLPLQGSNHLEVQPHVDDDSSSSQQLQHSEVSDVEPMDQDVASTELEALYLNSTGEEGNGEEVIIFLREVEEVGNSTASEGNGTVAAGNGTESNSGDAEEEDDSIFNVWEDAEESGNGTASGGNGTTSNGNGTTSNGNGTEASGGFGNSTQGSNETESLGGEEDEGRMMLRRSLGDAGNSTESNADQQEEEDDSIFNVWEDASDEEGSGNGTVAGGSGNNTLSGSGNSTLSGGNGNSTFSIGSQAGNGTEEATGDEEA